MDAKENTVVVGFTVKSEPREVALPSCSYATGSTSKPVKSEQTDNTRVFLDRGLPIPSYVQGDITSASLNRAGSASSIDLKPEDGLPQRNVLNHQEQPEVVNPTHFTIYNSSDDIAPTPETAFKEGLGMVKAVKESLKKLALGSKLRREVWDRDVANLEGECAPKTLIAVCGATGAGKSSVLNALLNDNIVPTSGMRACTAVVTEISYHKKLTIDADISFLSENEWRQELGVLLHDIVDEDGNVKRVTDLKSDAGVAWQKVHAVYPKITQETLVKMSVGEIINYDASISRILGATKTISAKDSKAFTKEIAKYIDSKDQKRGKKDKDKKDKKEKEKSKEPNLMNKARNAAGLASRSTATASKSKDTDPDAPALWPLIRQVNVRCNAEPLSTGAVLVDLPGVADANAARNNIAKDYMKKCNCIWILAPITRAVDDKTARDLLGDAFKMQLMMDGNYDDHAITFIASKCDDISCSEVIRALRLEDDPVLEEIEDRLTTLRQDISDCKRSKSNAEKEVKAIKEELESIREQQKNHEAHLEALKNGETFNPATTTKGKKRKNTRGGKKGSPKRRRNDSEDEDDFIDDGDSSEESESESESGSDNNSDSEDVSSDRSGSDSEAEDQDEEMAPVTEESLKEKIKECKEAIKAARERNNETRLRKKEAGDALSSLEKTLTKVQKEKNAFCSLKRSEFSRDVLKEDFRTGLKDLDDAAAEERDPENFDPSYNVRDYDAIDLPVFTCSSRDYVRLMGLAKGDGPPACFSNVQDTGIPDLQKWCHQLTSASRERAARTFFAHLKTFAQSVQTYVKGIGDVTATDREALREKWESRGFNEARHGTEEDDPLAAILGDLGAGLGAGLYTMNKPKVDPDSQPGGITHRLCTDFAKLVDQCVEDLQQNFKDGLEEKCRVGAANASDAALPTVEEFASSMHWATYRATLRRHGSWRRDLNVELINPFTRNIAHSWSKVFESDLFGPFEKATIEAINRLVKDVEGSAALGLKDRARLQGETCVEEARVALNKTVDLVKETMNAEQKEVSRCLAPHVQEELVEGYDRAMEERGTGSVARQKTYFRGFVNDCKDTIFDDGADVVLERLTKAAEAIGETLDDAMGKLAEKVEVSMAVLWEGARDNPQQQRARAETIKVVETVQQQVEFWTEAEKLAEAAKRFINMDED